MLQEKYAAEIASLIQRYPNQRSAVLPLLYLAQDTYGPLTRDVIREVAQILDISPTDVFEVVGFYTLFYDRPFGRWMVQVCDDVPCCYLGAEELIAALKQRLNIREEETSSDGMFTLQRVKCLAACHRAPVVQANLSFFYDVTVDKVDAFLRYLREHASSEQAASVSGHHAEDFEPGTDGTFRMIERHLSRLPAAPAQEERPPEEQKAAGAESSSQPAEPAQQAAAEQAAEESPVAASPDQTPASAHPAPERQDDAERVPAHAAQQEPAQQEG